MIRHRVERSTKSIRNPANTVKSRAKRKIVRGLAQEKGTSQIVARWNQEALYAAPSHGSDRDHAAEIATDVGIECVFRYSDERFFHTK